MIDFDHAYGRRPYDDSKAFLPFSEIRDAVTIPDHPLAYDAIAGWTGWKILGNDQAGDCVAVTWATVRRIVTKLFGTESYPTIDMVWKVYKTQNPGFDPKGTSSTNGPGSSYDQGMSIQKLLELLVQVGGPDGVKALCFAKVDHTNIEEVEAALSIFGFLWTGVNVTDTNESQFPHSAWTRVGNVVGGHSVTSTGYTGTDVIKGETWASEFSMAKGYFTGGTSRGAGVEELWIVVWPEHAAHLTDAQKTALNTSYRALTGQDIAWGDVPSPGPFPGPEPTPAPQPDPQLAAVLASALRRFVPHESCPDYLREAAEPWLTTQP